MNVLKETSSESCCTKTHVLSKMAEGRFASVSSVEEIILKQENKNTTQITERDVRLLARYFENEGRRQENRRYSSG